MFEVLKEVDLRFKSKNKQPPSYCFSLKMEVGCNVLPEKGSFSMTVQIPIICQLI